MRSRNKLTALFATAVVVAAAFLTAGYSTVTATQPAAASAARPVDLNSILIPPNEHPAGSVVFTQTTLKKAAAQVLPGTGEPSGVVVMPRCMSYFAVLGGLDKLEGAYQFGARADGTIFVHFVAKVSGGDAVELIKLRIGACHEGLMTFQGWPPSATNGARKTDGVLTFPERPAQALPGAKTYAVNQVVTFKRPSDPVVKSIRQAWACPDRPCESPITFVERNGLLIWVLDAQADQMAKTLYERSRA